MKPYLTFATAICLFLAATALAQDEHLHAVPGSPSIVASAEENPQATEVADTSVTDHSRCLETTDDQHAHQSTQQLTHVSLMVGIGAPDVESVFQEVGVGYEYRFPGGGGLFGVGISGMAMIFKDRTHLMVMGLGTIHPSGEFFFQVETGMAHAHNASSRGRHQMALLGGLGVGHHWHIVGVAIAPILVAEYSRVQKPTYSFMVCLGL